MRFALSLWYSRLAVICPYVSTRGPRLCFYQTRSAWSMDQGSNKNHSPAYHFAPTVTKFCVMWEVSSLPHDTKFGNCRCEIVDSRAFPSWSLIHGLRWSGLIKAEPLSLCQYKGPQVYHCVWCFRTANLAVRWRISHRQLSTYWVKIRQLSGRAFSSLSDNPVRYHIWIYQIQQITCFQIVIQVRLG